MKNRKPLRLVIAVTVFALGLAGKATAQLAPDIPVPHVPVMTAASVARSIAPPNPRMSIPNPALGITHATLNPNLYGYVNGNPVNFRDPAGMGAEGAATGAKVGGAIFGTIGVITGGAGGGLACSATGPVALACAAEGAVQGGIAGTSMGGIAGAAVGDLVEDICNMAGKSKSDKCYEQCEHLLPSPSGDLQSSEYTQCFRQCMGYLK